MRHLPYTCNGLIEFRAGGALWRASQQRAEDESLRRGSGRAGEGAERTRVDALRGRIKVLQVTAAANDATPLASPRNVLLRSAPTLAERLSLMRPVTALMIVCLSACGGSPALEQARDVQYNWDGRQAQLDAQAIMAGMDQARVRAAILARMGH